MEIRNIPVPARDRGRVESGPITFSYPQHDSDREYNDDWPGVFLRGDFCIALRIRMKELLKDYQTHSPDSAFIKSLNVSLLNEFIKYIDQATGKEQSDV